MELRRLSGEVANHCHVLDTLSKRMYEHNHGLELVVTELIKRVKALEDG